MLGHPFGTRLRRTFVPDVPYALLYRAEPDRTYILRVARPHCCAGYWQSRDRGVLPNKAADGRERRLVARCCPLGRGRGPCAGRRGSVLAFASGRS